jgi:hypothetical protein
MNATMERTTTRLLFLAVFAPLLAAEDPSARVLGRWRSLGTSSGGIGVMFEFRKDNVVDFCSGAAVEATYRIEGDQLILPPEVKDGPELNQTMEWLGDDKLRLSQGNDLVVELARAGTRPDAKNRALGEWVAQREMAGGKLEVRYFFYPAGKALVLLPFLTQRGSYTLGDGTIRLELPGKDPVEGKFKVEGDALTLPDGSRLARY